MCERKFRLIFDSPFAAAKRSTGQPFQIISQKLPQTSTERNTAHCVQKKIDAEVGVEKQHCELLQTIEDFWGIFVLQGVGEKCRQTDDVAEKEFINTRV